MGFVTDMQERARIIDGMVRWIVDHRSPECVILFGPHARADADGASDVDLLVVMPDGPHRRKTAALYALLAGRGVGKDIVVATAGDIARHGDVPDTVLCPALRKGRTRHGG